MSLADELCGVLAPAERDINLTRAAALVSRIEYPDLDTAECERTIERFAERIAPDLNRDDAPYAVLQVINGYFFEEWGFRGNESDYYDPRNSFLNDVLERRGGIPITLSVVYLEVARHLMLPIFGVGLPAHFLVKYDDGKWLHFIDVFARGRIIDRDGCRELVRGLGVDADLTEETFATLEKRHIILRMLNNLRGIYLHRRQYRKALAVLDLILGIEPDSHDVIKQRAWLYSEIGQQRRAVTDLERYMELNPHAADSDELKQWIARTRREIASLN